MKVAAFIVALAVLVAAPAADAGTASKPEVTDESGDKVSSIPGLGANSIDINKAWIDQETPDAFVFILDVSGSFDPDPTETLAYEWNLDLAGTSYTFGAEVWDQGAQTTTSATGIASEAAHDGAGKMTISVPRSAFTDVAPGQSMAAITVAAQAYVGSPVIWNDSDDAVGSRAYTIGAQADPSMDHDGDGHPDFQEIAQGSDPTNPEDPPAYIPPTTSADLAAEGGSYDLEALTPMSESFEHTWASTLADSNITLNATVEGGALTVSLADGAGNFANATVDASGNQLLDAAMLMPGNWTLTLVGIDFQGALTLAVAPLAAETPEGEESSTEETEEPTESAPVDSTPTSKKTPAPFVLPIALLGAALMRRRA